MSCPTAIPALPAPPFSLRRIAIPAFGPSTLAAVGTGAVLPVLALTARDLGASVGIAAFLVALGSVAHLVTSLPAGALVARMGERRALALAAGLNAIGGLIALASASLWMLGVAVLVMGATESVFLLARQAYLTDAVPLPMRARALSTLGGVTRIGLFVGPFIGAAVVGMWGTRAAFGVAVAAALAALAVTLLTDDITRAHERADGRRDPAPVLRVLRDHRRVLLTVGVGVLIITAARGSRIVLLPLWSEAVGLSAARTSLVFGVAAFVDMLLFYPAGSVMDRFGRVWVAVPCVVLLGAGTALLPLAHTVATIGALAVVMAIGNGMGSGIVMTLGADASPTIGRAQFLGGWRLLSEAGGSGGPLLIAALVAAGSLGLACATLGGLAIAGGAWLARWVPRRAPA